MKPKGGASTRHAADEPARKEGLLEQVLASENMQRAWQQVRANQGAAGIDGMSVQQFPSFACEHWPAIRQSVMTETYQPAAVRRVEIPKPDGGRRPLGIPTVLDRVIQQALAQVLNPIFDPLFAETSYGFRPNRSAHAAVQQVRSYIQQGYRMAVDVDLSKFFDTVNHDVLMSRLARRVRDPRVLRLSHARAGTAQVGHVPTDGDSSGLESESRVRRDATTVSWSQHTGPAVAGSKTLATQSGMTNQWLSEQGLVSIQTLWVAFHYPPNAAKG